VYPCLGFLIIFWFVQVFGKIFTCKVRTDTFGKSLCFGFVQFDSEEAAEMAILVMDQIKIQVS
jgi:RNA recognition motif-containing protein